MCLSWQSHLPCAVLVSLWVLRSPSFHAVHTRCQNDGYQCLGVGLLVTENHSKTEKLLFFTAMKANEGHESKRREQGHRAPESKAVQSLGKKAQTWPGPGVTHKKTTNTNNVKIPLRKSELSFCQNDFT